MLEIGTKMTDLYNLEFSLLLATDGRTLDRFVTHDQDRVISAYMVPNSTVLSSKQKST